MDYTTVQSQDGTHIAYDVAGQGLPLLLLHGGYIQTRQAWHDVGYVDQLRKHYTTVSIDLRGHGQSDGPTNPEAYTTEKIIADILAVANAENFRQFALIGFSLGANVALQMASASNRVRSAIIVGGGFGQIFTKTSIDEQINWTQTVIKAVEEGRVDALGLNPKWRDRILQSNLYTRLAWTKALLTWRPIHPKDVICPALMIAGSANEAGVTNLKQYEREMKAQKIAYHIIDGLDHSQEFREIDTVLPLELTFLQSNFG